MKIGSISHSSTQRSTSLQQKNNAKNPSFGSVAVPVVLAAGAVAVAPLIWIDNQKWSGKTFDQIKKEDEMKTVINVVEKKTTPFTKFITKLLKGANSVA